MDKPILKIVNGVKEWTVNGIYHRDDGPAIDFGMVQIWYQHGSVHREGGPAVEYDDGDIGWYYHGVCYTLQEYLDILSPSPAEKTLLLLKYG